MGYTAWGQEFREPVNNRENTRVKSALLDHKMHIQRAIPIDKVPSMLLKRASDNSDMIKVRRD